MNQQEYAKKVKELEAEGICTSDAQAIVDAEMMQPKIQAIELKHNQIVRGFGFSQYANKIKIGTARGFAHECNSDPEEAHEHCLIRGHATAWTNQAASVLSDDYAGKAEAHDKTLQQIRDSVILAENQLVTIEGEMFKVRLAGDRYSDPIHFIRIA